MLSFISPALTHRIAKSAALISLGILFGCGSVVIPAPGSTTAAPVTSPISPVTVVVGPTTFSPALNSTSDFIGASIIHYWPLPMHNDGIPGQTSAQVLARFSNTVLNHGYQRVIILCGSNDIIDRVPNLTTELPANLKAMADIATAAGIEVVLSKLPPMFYITTPNPLVPIANDAIAQMAAQNGYLIVDYYTPLIGHPEDFPDGTHPNAAGYTIMEQALSAVVLH